MVLRVLQVGGDEEGGDQADGQVDEEDPGPGVVVGQPAAEHGRDGGGDDDAQAEDGLHHALLLGGKISSSVAWAVESNAPPPTPLQDAPEDEFTQGTRRAAEEGRQDEQQDGRDQVALAPEPRRQPGGQGQDDDDAEDIAGADPADLVGGRAEVAAHLGQGDVDDGGVQRLHDDGADEADQNDPAVGADGGRRGGLPRQPLGRRLTAHHRRWADPGGAGVQKRRSCVTLFSLSVLTEAARHENRNGLSVSSFRMEKRSHLRRLSIQRRICLHMTVVQHIVHVHMAVVHLDRAYGASRGAYGASHVAHMVHPVAHMVHDVEAGREGVQVPK